jgi:hypothetical protein
MIHCASWLDGLKRLRAKNRVPTEAGAGLSQSEILVSTRASAAYSDVHYSDVHKAREARAEKPQQRPGLRNNLEGSGLFQP